MWRIHEWSRWIRSLLINWSFWKSRYRIAFAVLLMISAVNKELPWRAWNRIWKLFRIMTRLFAYLWYYTLKGLPLRISSQIRPTQICLITIAPKKNKKVIIQSRAHPLRQCSDAIICQGRWWIASPSTSVNLKCQNKAGIIIPSWLETQLTYIRLYMVIKINR